MRGIILCFIIGLAELAMAQTTASELTPTEKLALKQVGEEFSAFQRDLQALQSEVEKNHPGMTLDLQTGSLVPKPAPTPKK